MHIFITVDSIIKHIASLRSQYMRYRKLAPSGSGAKRIKTLRQEWVLKNIRFMEPWVKKRESESNLCVRIIGLLN